MALFILVLAVFQCVVALVGGLMAHLVTNVPRWRRLRGDLAPDFESDPI